MINFKFLHTRKFDSIFLLESSILMKDSTDYEKQIEDLKASYEKLEFEFEISLFTGGIFGFALGLMACYFTS